MNAKTVFIVLMLFNVCFQNCKSMISTSCEDQHHLKEAENSHISKGRAKRSVQLWDQTAETAEQFQGRICTEECWGTNKFEYIKCGLKCFDCNCFVDCGKHGRCCKGSDETEWSPPPIERAMCMKDVYNNYILRVLACHPDYPKDETRHLCESKSVPRRRDTVLPVTSNTTSVTYINEHCATCNYENTTVDWIIYCFHNMYLYNVTNDTQYDERAIQLPEVCSFVPSNMSSSRNFYYRCPAPIDPAEIISTCNVTGLWEAENEHVREACEQSEWKQGAMVFVNESGVFANVFCVICNGKIAEMESCLKQNSTTIIDTPIDSPKYPDVRTTTGLVNFKRSLLFITTRELGVCSADQWKHPQGNCRELQCTAGKVVATQEKCETPVRRVRGLGYHVKVLLRPVSLLYKDTDSLQNTSSAFSLTTTIPTSYTVQTAATATGQDTYTTPNAASTIGRNTFYTKSTAATSVRRDTSPTSNTCAPPYSYASLVLKKMESRIYHYGAMQANITTASTPHEPCVLEMYRPLLEKLIKLGDATDVKTKEKKVDFDVDAPGKASFLAIEIEADLISNGNVDRDFFEETIISAIFNDEWTLVFDKWTVVLKALDLTSELQVRGEAESAFTAYTGIIGRTMNAPYPFELLEGNSSIGLEHLFLPLCRRLLCSYLTFELDEFEVQVLEGRVLVKFPFFLDSDKNPITFDARNRSGESWLEGTENKLAVCFTTYQQVFPENITIVKPRPGASMARQIMSAVCGSISVVCLAITFLTYSLFRELRSLPGLNNMGLSVSLGIAQLTLLIPWHRTNIAGFCRAVGLFTHWIWLMAISWMAVCCLHMACVFVSKTRHALTYRETKKAFFLNVLRTVLVSTSIVVLTISVSLGMSAGFNMGYGGNSCFLDTGLHHLLILTFLLPLGLTVTINLICFGITVAAIMKVRRLQAQALREQRDILVYAKLVTVTGGAWLLGLLSELADQEWMLVAAELFTATQGLLVFLAFVCNMRVWQLYRAWFGHPMTVSTSADTAVTGDNFSETDTS